MRTKILGAAVFAMSFMMLAGCGKKGGGGDEAKFEAYVNEVCACKDMECYTKASAKMAEEAKGKKAGEVKEPSKKMLELTAKMTKCVTDLTSKAAPAPAPAPEAEKPAEGGEGGEGGEGAEGGEGGDDGAE